MRKFPETLSSVVPGAPGRSMVVVDIRDIRRRSNLGKQRDLMGYFLRYMLIVVVVLVVMMMVTRSKWSLGGEQL